MRRRNPERLPVEIFTARELTNLIAIAANVPSSSYEDASARSTIEHCQSIKAQGAVWIEIDYRQ